tara:strand:+ start:837 stop:1208 length:372 start_codon:yes stop_codon:yes gene_type:complete
MKTIAQKIIDLNNEGQHIEARKLADKFLNLNNYCKDIPNDILHALKYSDYIDDEMKCEELSNEITYDDTRDVSIRCVKKLIDLGYIEDNEDIYFEIQDIIQDEINLLLELDIDENFSINYLKN